MHSSSDSSLDSRVGKNSGWMLGWKNDNVGIKSFGRARIEDDFKNMLTKKHKNWQQDRFHTKKNNNYIWKTKNQCKRDLYVNNTHEMSESIYFM